jgi:hypothetical protein
MFVLCYPHARYYIAYNGISGTIPTDIGLLSNLIYLDLGTCLGVAIAETKEETPHPITCCCCGSCALYITIRYEYSKWIDPY